MFHKNSIFFIVVTDVLDEFLKRAELNEFLNEIKEFLTNF